MAFNQSQIKAVDFKDGACMVLAGPGSGKTTVITHRTKKLIEEYGVNPSNILVITFTKAAATEMQTRFQALMGGRYYPVTFGTFHAVYFKILKYAYNKLYNSRVSPCGSYTFCLFFVPTEISCALHNARR